jgi:glycolate oxidase
MINNLIKIFGEEFVSIEKSDLLSVSKDASGLSGKAQAVVWPSNDIQIHELIKLVIRLNKHITIRGAGTNLCGSTIPDGGIVVDFSKMNKILEINVQKKEVICEPGVVINDLNLALDEYDLFFPVIPSSYMACQIGGIFSTNASGLNAIYYGKARKWVSSITYFDGGGKQRFAKNNSDLDELVGSEGILALFTRFTLKLTEVVTNKSMDIFKIKKVDEVVEKVNELRLNPSVISLEYIDKLSSEISGHGSYYYLIVEYNDNSLGKINDLDGMNEIWSKRKKIGYILSSKKYNISEDPFIPFEKYSPFIRWLNSNQIPSFGHIGVGIFHPRFSLTNKKLIPEMFKIVKSYNGVITGEHGVGCSKKEYLSNDKINYYKELKKKYDPDNIFNRGIIL